MIVYIIPISWKQYRFLESERQSAAASLAHFAAQRTHLLDHSLRLLKLLEQPVDLLNAGTGTRRNTLFTT